MTATCSNLYQETNHPPGSKNFIIIGIGEKCLVDGARSCHGGSWWNDVLVRRDLNRPPPPPLRTMTRWTRILLAPFTGILGDGSTTRKKRRRTTTIVIDPPGCLPPIKSLRRKLVWPMLRMTPPCLLGKPSSRMNKKWVS